MYTENTSYVCVCTPGLELLVTLWSTLYNTVVSYSFAAFTLHTGESTYVRSFI